MTSHVNALQDSAAEVSNELATPLPAPPRSAQEVMHTQLDIIVSLCVAGVDPVEKDEKGHTASYRACRQLETPFLEGAFLLGRYRPWIATDLG